MGNYEDIERDFIDRTLLLISQYESILHRFPFEEQYNYTLLINCLLGVIVLPNARLYSHIPNSIITTQLKNDMGLINSRINSKYQRLRDLIHAMRNSIAHFSVEIISNSEDFLVDNIVFRKPQNEGGEEIANFQASELLPFIRYYADWTRTNLTNYR